MRNRSPFAKGTSKENGVEGGNELNASADGGQLPTAQAPLTETPTVSDRAETGARPVVMTAKQPNASSFDFIAATPRNEPPQP
jgi:hypothetical protein